MQAFEKMQAKGKIDVRFLQNNLQIQTKELSKLGVDPGVFDRKTSQGGFDRSRDGLNEHSKTMQASKMNMSGTFKITSREAASIGQAQAHLVKSEQRMRNNLNRTGAVNKS